MLNGGRTFKMAEKRKWTDEEVVRIIDPWEEETIQFSLDNAKAPKEKTSVYKTLEIVPVSNETLFLPRFLAYLVLSFTLSTFLLGFVCFPQYTEVTNIDNPVDGVLN